MGVRPCVGGEFGSHHWHQLPPYHDEIGRVADGDARGQGGVCAKLNVGLPYEQVTSNGTRLAYVIPYLT